MSGREYINEVKRVVGVGKQTGASASTRGSATENRAKTASHHDFSNRARAKMYVDSEEECSPSKFPGRS